MEQVEIDKFEKFTLWYNLTDKGINNKLSYAMTGLERKCQTSIRKGVSSILTWVNLCFRKSRHNLDLRHGSKWALSRSQNLFSVPVVGG